MESNYQSYKNPGKRKKVLSLLEISIKKCIQHVATLEDVGTTPFHLLFPVLGRMNAKQLAQIESSSPQITPDSDELWTSLVGKEFPDRPILTNSGRAKKNKKTNAVRMGPELMFCDMPMKSLYYRYSDERASFREDSAERLRTITQRLKKEKSANSIVSVPQLLRDPTVRSRKFNGGSSYSRPEASYERKNSILNKARREIRNRSLMFPNYAKNVKKYDPYDAFNHRDSPFIKTHPKVPPQPIQQPKPSSLHPSHQQKMAQLTRSIHTPRFNHDRKDIPFQLGRSPTIFNGQPIQQNTVVPKPIDSAPRASSTISSSASSPNPTSPRMHLLLPERHSPPTSVSSSSSLPRAMSETIRKRKPEPSIFLTVNRNKRPMRVPRAQIKGLVPSNDTSTEPHKKITMIKSSIFN